MRVSPLFLAGLVVACAGAPPPAPKPAAPKVAVAPPKAEPEPPAPPEPLSEESVDVAVKDGFLTLGLDNVRPKLLSEDELVQRLPYAAKREVDAIFRARKALRDAQRKYSKASGAYYRCDDCPQRAQLDRNRKAAMKVSSNARKAQYKAIAHAEKALDKMLAAPKAKPEVGIALARIRARRSDLNGNDVHWVRYGEPTMGSLGTSALKRAAELAGPDVEIGREVRHELLNGLWAKGQSQLARSVIAELEPVAPPEWRAELAFRSALLDALEGDHAKAADGFEKALAAHVPGSSVTRRMLAKAVLAARYRALDFERALPAAFQALDESARPEPAPPAPPAPKKPAKPTKATVKAIAKTSALSQAAEFGMLGLLSTSGSADLDEDGIARLAADCVERLGKDPMKLSASAEARTRVLSVLATRALYRNDDKGARELAEAARALGTFAATRGAIDVLEALAIKSGDAALTNELQREKGGLPWGRSGTWTNSYSEPDARGLARVLRQSAASEQEPEEDREPLVARNVRSVVRACVEPVRTSLPRATGNGKDRKIATITLHAKVFDDAHVELSTSSDSDEGSVRQVLDCLNSMGPKVLAHAPSSVTARVTLDDAVRRPGGWGSGLGGLVGDQVGEAFGYGGLGLSGVGRGGGGTGTGTIGLGSVGVIGHGSGTGVGYGSGKGRLGGKKPTPKTTPAPKMTPAPQKAP